MKNAVIFILGAVAGVALCLTAASMIPDDESDPYDFPDEY